MHMPPAVAIALLLMGAGVGAMAQQGGATSAAAPTAIAAGSRSTNVASTVEGQALPTLAEPAGDPPLGGEPNVRISTIEDRGSRIDEVRIRGQVQRIVVTPRVGPTKPYEIIVNRTGRETDSGTGGADSAVGKRVWNVLAF